LKELKLAQLYKVLYKRFTAVCLEENLLVNKRLWWHQDAWCSWGGTKFLLWCNESNWQGQTMWGLTVTF